ncbi:hypothetical protein DMC30DRAFT_302080 [Rhodotorula diobovata]|uniref:Uncharacterized protein n=1 Tax=Rhodotorula diobovata TaxID=5288 RepID=A0A5C5FRL7_9BASI|nr:hypothetical protein DMC30DRAFT_302080 [Rhodotorula diobovata]
MRSFLPAVAVASAVPTQHCRGTITSLNDVAPAVNRTRDNIQSFAVPTGKTFELDLLAGTVVHLQGDVSSARQTGRARSCSSSSDQERQGHERQRPVHQDLRRTYWRERLRHHLDGQRRALVRSSALLCGPDERCPHPGVLEAPSARYYGLVRRRLL